MKVAVRAGIVLSVLWFIFAGSWEFLEEGWRGADYAIQEYKFCEQIHDMPVNQAKPDTCIQSYDHDFQLVAGTPMNRALGAVFVGSLPIPLAWGLALLLVRTTRWIIYGRWKPKNNS